MDRTYDVILYRFKRDFLMAQLYLKGAKSPSSVTGDLIQKMLYWIKDLYEMINETFETNGVKITKTNNEINIYFTQYDFEIEIKAKWESQSELVDLATVLTNVAETLPTTDILWPGTEFKIENCERLVFKGKLRYTKDIGRFEFNLTQKTSIEQPNVVCEQTRDCVFEFTEVEDKIVPGKLMVQLRAKGKVDILTIF